MAAERRMDAPPSAVPAPAVRRRCRLHAERDPARDARGRVCAVGAAVRGGGLRRSVISDRWAGIETIFAPGEEILLADRAADVIRILEDIDPVQRRSIGGAARRRVIAEHTAERRVEQLHTLVLEAQREAVS